MDLASPDVAMGTVKTWWFRFSFFSVSWMCQPLFTFSGEKQTRFIFLSGDPPGYGTVTGDPPCPCVDCMRST